ncbi:hypothetical protein, partial [Candidatus Erwinia dacicola]|uniref:hypothetical protein n=1 Tax=Candidatus Erwinia dacicola TaxID=252393 RepID=UPI001C9936CE
TRVYSVAPLSETFMPIFGKNLLRAKARTGQRNNRKTVLNCLLKRLSNLLKEMRPSVDNCTVLKKYGRCWLSGNE